ncbi:MAG: NAD(P)-binding domain-containing protein [Candidatus Omnitrophota bacterium]
MQSTVKRVAVIGAGPAGLVTVKELLEAGQSVLCFEKTTDLGGVFQFEQDKGCAYTSLQLTSSAAITCFSDFAPPKNAPHHFMHNEYFQYLSDYAAHFGLRKHIRFAEEVKKIKQNKNGTWTVISQNLHSHKEEEHLFDAVAVCSGVHQSPYIPALTGLETFTGEALHSIRYKNPDRFKGKRVVVVGAGESASDIVDEVSKVSTECILSIRRGTMIIPRTIFGNPNDYYTNRFFYMLPTWFVRQLDRKSFLPRIILGGLAMTFIYLLFSFIEQCFYWFVPPSKTLNTFFYFSVILLCIYLIYAIIRLVLLDLPIDVMKAIRHQLSDLEVGHAGQFTTKSTGMARAVAEKRCSVKKGIDRFEGAKVIFSDQTEFQADTVIFCTGYEVNFPFLQKNRVDLRKFYKNCFSADSDSTLAFIGFARPAIGAIPPIAEMQARWFASLLSGRTRLPPPEIMAREIEADAKWHKTNFFKVSDRVTGLVEYTRYMDELAEKIGCRPRWTDLLRHPRLLIPIFTNPFSANQYRFQGTPEQKKIAGNTLTRIPPEPFWVIYCLGLAATVCVSQILYLLGFKRFKLNLPLGQKKSE